MSAPAAPAPAAPAPAAAPAPVSAPAAPAPSAPAEAQTTPIRGVAAKIVSNMDASLQVPTATSVRAVPAKLLADNRIVINNHLARGRGGKVSFTHIIGYAVVKALAAHPEMNNSFATSGGKPVTVSPGAVNLGIAIDLARPDGSRTLVVPSIKNAEAMDFRQFWQSYEDLIRRARRNELTMDDYAGTTISLTNPGGIGTVHSMPRLMQGQGTIIGVGAMEHPAEFAGMSDDQLADLAISKIITLTSTYDHRIIQGAQSGEFLKVIHELLLGGREFYDGIFTSLRIPYEPIRWTRDVAHTSEGQIDKAARVIELIHAYRVRGHLMADTDPIEYHIRHHPDLDIREHELTLWDLDRHIPGWRVRRAPADEAARHPRRAAGLVLPADRHRVHAHPGSGGAALDPGAGGAPLHQAHRRRSSATSWSGSTRPRPSRPSCRPSSWGRSGSRSRAARA